MFVNQTVARKQKAIAYDLATKVEIVKAVEQSLPLLDVTTCRITLSTF